MPAGAPAPTHPGIKCVQVPPPPTGANVEWASRTATVHALDPASHQAIKKASKLATIVHMAGTPVLGADAVLAKLQSFSLPGADVNAFYSSELGGIVTDHSLCVRRWPAIAADCHSKASAAA